MNTRVNLHICDDIPDLQIGAVIHKEITCGATEVHVYMHESYQPEHDIFDRAFYRKHYTHTIAERTRGAIVRFYLPNDEAKIILENAKLN